MKINLMEEKYLLINTILSQWNEVFKLEFMPSRKNNRFKQNYLKKFNQHLKPNEFVRCLMNQFPFKQCQLFAFSMSICSSSFQKTTLLSRDVNRIEKAFSNYLPKDFWVGTNIEILFSLLLIIRLAFNFYILLKATKGTSVRVAKMRKESILSAWP